MFADANEDKNEVEANDGLVEADGFVEADGLVEADGGRVEANGGRL